MVSVIETTDLANRILGQVNMDFSYIEEGNVFIGNFLVAKENNPIPFELALLKIEAAIISIQMNQLNQILKEERNREDLKLNLED